MQRGGNNAKRIHKKNWLERRALRRFLNPRDKAYRPRTSAIAWGSVNQHTRGSIKGVANQPLEIRLPARLDFEENYETTVSHFRHVRDAARGRYRIKRLGFEDIAYISPAAALVLASEVDRWKEGTVSMRADTDSWNPDVK